MNAEDIKWAALEAKWAMWTPLPAGFDFRDRAAWVNHCTDNYAHLTCKACDALESPKGWWVVEGDVNCAACALAADKRNDDGGTDIRRIPTPAQRADRADRDAQDIGW